jgi:hypothetical protein
MADQFPLPIVEINGPAEFFRGYPDIEMGFHGGLIIFQQPLERHIQKAAKKRTNHRRQVGVRPGNRLFHVPEHSERDHTHGRHHLNRRMDAQISPSMVMLGTSQYFSMPRSMRFKLAVAVRQVNRGCRKPPWIWKSRICCSRNRGSAWGRALPCEVR